MLHYGAENNEVNEDSSANKNVPYSEQQDSSAETKEESIADLVRRLLYTDTEKMPGDTIDETQSAEAAPSGHEQFNAEIAGYKAFIKLRKDEVLFLNQRNEPVGQPQKFADFVDSKQNFTGDYLYTPGTTDETGILTDVPAREWREYLKDKLQAEYPDQKITDDMNTILFFRDAYESGDAELRQQISRGEIVSRDQVIDYRIVKDFSESEGYNRVGYLQNHVRFRSEREEVPGVPGAEKVAVPSVVQAELRRLLPGLFAQESGFREDIVNSQTHATGSGQFMPETWERYTGTDRVSTNYTEQVAVLGPMVSDVYDRILDKIGADELRTLRSLYATEDEFLTNLITPAVISGFHTGPDRIAAAAKGYVQSVQKADMPTGKDLFLAIATYGVQASEDLLGGFKKESREYVTKVYAAAEVLEEKYPPAFTPGVQLAQN